MAGTYLLEAVPNYERPAAARKDAKSRAARGGQGQGADAGGAPAVFLAGPRVGAMTQYGEGGSPWIWIS